MKSVIICPECEKQSINLCAYESMMVLRADIALFVVECSCCGTVISCVNAIPAELREDVQCAAIEVDAGMGCDV